MWRTIAGSLGEGPKAGKGRNQAGSERASKGEEQREKVPAAYMLLISLLVRPSSVPGYCSLSLPFFPLYFLCKLVLHSVSSRDRTC